MKKGKLTDILYIIGGLLIIGTIIAAVLIFNKHNEDQEIIDNETNYHNLVKQELESGQRYDSIFLDYKLGMSKKEFLEHTALLVKNKEIHYLDNKLIYTMQYMHEENKYNISIDFVPEFFNDSLYMLVLKTEIETSYNYNSSALTASIMSSMFAEKYGWEYVDLSFKSKIKDGEEITNIKWVNGNREIEISEKLDACEIYYTDINLKNSKEKFELNQLNMESEKVKNDI